MKQKVTEVVEDSHGRREPVELRGLKEQVTGEKKGP